MSSAALMLCGGRVIIRFILFVRSSDRPPTRSILTVHSPVHPSICPPVHLHVRPSACPLHLDCSFSCPINLGRQEDPSFATIQPSVASPPSRFHPKVCPNVNKNVLSAEATSFKVLLRSIGFFKRNNGLSFSQ